TGTIMPGFPRRIAPSLYGMPNARHQGYINAPIMADLDGDGTLEIIAMTNTTRVRAYHYTGQRAMLRPSRAKALPNRQCVSPLPPYRRIVSLPPILEPPTAGDLNGDGRAEILVSGHTKTWKGRGLRNG